jgi:hypothetical protein
MTRCSATPGSGLVRYRPPLKPPGYITGTSSLRAPPTPFFPSSIILAQPIPCPFLPIFLSAPCVLGLYFLFRRWLQSSGPSVLGDSLDPPAMFPEERQATSELTPRSSLPLELVERIADFLFQTTPAVHGSSMPESMLCVKPLWRDVAGFMGASPILHKMGYRRWLQIISVKNVNDWNIITEHVELVRYRTELL